MVKRKLSQKRINEILGEKGSVKRARADNIFAGARSKVLLDNKRLRKQLIKKFR